MNFLLEGRRRLLEWQASRISDPIERLRGHLERDFDVPAARLAMIEGEAQARIEAAVAFALASPEPPPESAREHVFASQSIAR